MPDMDMSQYLDLFLQEAEEQLEILEQETLKLEQEPTAERMQVIFRAAHTLKGSSRAMGYLEFANLTHEMENLLDLLRAEKLSVTTEIADALLACIDSLGQAKTQLGEGKSESIDSRELVAKLRSLAEGTPGQGAATGHGLTDDDLANLAAKASQGTIYCAEIQLRGDCVMKFVRAFMALSAVQESGTLLVCDPPREALEEEKFEDSFRLYFQSNEAPDAWKARFMAIGEVLSVGVSTWEPPTEAQRPASAESPKPLAEGSAKAAAKKADPSQAVSGQTVRVDVARLDELMNLVGELVIDRTRVAQIGAVLSSKYQFEENVEALGETVSHIARITGDLQDQIMKARMLPIETVFNRFPRMVRDLANKVGKDIKLELIGGDTELDRSVIEVIGDPLLHILRNSVDHGIESPADREALNKPATGQITISARHQENHIVIDIADDGKGIDVERVKHKALQQGLITVETAERMTDKDALQLIFASGLSTAKEVSEVSGRGVGMDIVKSNIQKLGGIIDVESFTGEGSRFSLRLPLTLAIIRGLLVAVSEVVYVLPLGSVIETLLVSQKEIQTVHGREVILIRGVTTPLVRMNRVFHNPKSQYAKEGTDSFVVIVGIAEQRIGLVVDRLIGEQEVVIKSLSSFCGEIAGVSGATILGDGNVALIADVNGIIAQSRAA